MLHLKRNAAIGREIQHRPGSGVCGIFAIGLYHRAQLSNIYRLDVDEPERPTMTTTGRHRIRDQATENHSVKPGLCNITSDRADVTGHRA